MTAVGDADGTVHMMSLCRTLYDQTLQPKEKEIMLSIFEREARREKNLENAKRLAEQGKKPSDKKNAQQEEQKRVEKLKQQLDDITDKFYQSVADDEEQLAEIKERAEIQRIKNEEANMDRAETPAREFQEGQSYRFEMKWDSNEYQGTDALQFAIGSGGEVNTTVGDCQVQGSAQGTKMLLQIV
jgi:hypothetical protein